MSDLTIKLLELINEEKTVNEISKELNLSNKQIYSLLTSIRSMGYDFDRKYYYNGDIIYTKKEFSLEGNKRNGIDIITSPSDTDFKALVISDTHIGSEFERLDLLDKMYDYCVKEGINIILHCGDLNEGILDEKNRGNIKEVDKHINYVVKNYPFDKNILNFVVLGNHDIASLNYANQDIAKVFESRRHDIVVTGYGTGMVNIKNDKIVLKHKLTINDNEIIELTNSILLKGHSHHMKFSYGGKNLLTIGVPSFSDDFKNENDFLPGAVKMDLIMKDGVFIKGTFSHLLIDSKVHSINEIEYFLGWGKERDPKKILLEEDRSKKLTKKSQIDKFNKKYGIK